MNTPYCQPPRIWKWPLKAGASVEDAEQFVLEDVVIHQALILPEKGAGQKVQAILTPSKSGYIWQVYAAEKERNQPSWTLHAEGSLRATGRLPLEPVDVPALQAEINQAVAVDKFYQTLQDAGLNYGHSFRLLQQLWAGQENALGQIQLPENLVQEFQMYQLHPALLDACLHVSACSPHGRCRR